MSEMITQATVISMGWTKAMIKKLLPEPTLKTNPHYKCAAPMKLWDKDVVLAIMGTEDFASALEKSKNRKKSATKAIKTKEERLADKMIGNVKNISILVLTDDDLIDAALKEQEAHILNRLEEKVEYCYRNLGERATFDELEGLEQELQNLKDTGIRKPNDISTLNRWVVNYIRHNLVNYSSMLYQLRGKIGKEKAYYALKNAILDKIAEVYPTYADECYRQKQCLD